MKAIFAVIFAVASLALLTSATHPFQGVIGDDLGQTLNDIERMEHLNSISGCNGHSTVILERIFEKIRNLPSSPLNLRGIDVISLYFQKCAAVFNRVVGNYLTTMGVIGQSTRQWLSIMVNFFQEHGITGAASLIMSSTEPRQIIGLGDKLKKLVGAKITLKEEAEKPGLIYVDSEEKSRRVSNESFYYGEALCFHALQPPMKSVMMHTKSMLGNFGNLDTIKKIIIDLSPPPKLMLELSLGPGKSHESSEEVKFGFINFYLVQLYCSRLVDSSLSVLEDRAIEQKKVEILDYLEGWILSSAQMTLTELCSLKNLYNLKTAWRGYEKLKEESLKAGLESLTKGSILTKCILRFEITFFNNITPVKNLSDMDLKSFIWTADEIKMMARTALKQFDPKTTTYIENLQTHAYREEESSQLYSNLSRLAKCKHISEPKLEMVKQTFHYGEGICTYFTDQLAVYRDLSGLYLALESIEHYASSANFRLESFKGGRNVKKIMDLFNQFIICRNLRFFSIPKEGIAPETSNPKRQKV